MSHRRQFPAELATDDRPAVLQERAVLSKILEIDREPFIVFTSDIPGLVAAQQILGADHERVGQEKTERTNEMGLIPFCDPISWRMLCSHGTPSGAAIGSGRLAITFAARPS